MEEKERYELFGEFGIIHDTSPNAECMLLNKFQTCEILNKQDKENKQLKQQLHDLPKKIVEEIRDVAGDYWEECGNVPDLNTLTMEDFDEILDTILEKFGGKDEINND